MQLCNPSIGGLQPMKRMVSSVVFKGSFTHHVYFMNAYKFW
jgi:hypothetical protein